MKYGFIGCGNMGGAVARALAKSTKDVALADRSGSGRALASELGVSYSYNEAIAMECDRIFLAVKPHMMEGVLRPLQPVMAQRRPVLISMAAGLTVEEICKFAGTDLPVIRMMPNTPVSLGRGVVPYCHNEWVAPQVLEDWRQDMAHCGLLDPLEEGLMDAASALSGSGPAYLYVMLEAMADGAVACGLPRAKAMQYAAMTIAGAAEMALTSGQHPGALKDAVCSPGGSTIAGLRELELRGFRGAVMECVQAAWRKNQVLGK